MNSLTLIALTFIAIGGIGAILLTIGQTLSSQEDKSEIIGTLKADLTELKSERDTLSKKLDEQDSLLEDKTKKIIELNESLRHQSKYIEDYVTGGDSYPFALLEGVTTPTHTDGGELIMFYNRSKEFPLRSLIASIFDYDLIYKNITPHKITNEPSIKHSVLNSAEVLRIGPVDIPPSSSYAEDKPLPIKPKRYFIKIGTQSRKFIQKIVVISINNEGYYYGSQLFNLEGTLIEEDFYRFGHKITRSEKNEIKKELNKIPTKLELALTN